MKNTKHFGFSTNKTLKEYSENQSHIRSPTLAALIIMFSTHG
jgi:hypothetical protein